MKDFKPEYKLITLNVLKTWMPLIDEAKGDMNRSEWIRTIIRDALAEKQLFKVKKIYA